MGFSQDGIYNVSLFVFQDLLIPSGPPPLLLRLLRLPERANLKGDETEVLGFAGRALALALMSTVTLAHYREQFVRLTSCSNYSNPLFFFFFL